LRILYWPRVFWSRIGGVEVIAASLLLRGGRHAQQPGTTPAIGT
jgi:hypothetical protein